MELRRLPSVDSVLRSAAGAALIERHGHALTVAALRRALDQARDALRHGAPAAGPDTVAATAAAMLDASEAPRIRAVFNLTGTVLHTNLGRALLAEAAIEAATTAMRHGPLNISAKPSTPTNEASSRNDCSSRGSRAIARGGSGVSPTRIDTAHTAKAAETKIITA